MARERPLQIYNPLAHRPEELLGKYGDDELAQLAGDWRMFLVSVVNVVLWRLQTSFPPRSNLQHVIRNLPTT